MEIVVRKAQKRCVRKNVFVMNDAKLVHEVGVDESGKVGVSDSWLAKC